VGSEDEGSGTEMKRKEGRQWTEDDKTAE